MLFIKYQLVLNILKGIKTNLEVDLLAEMLLELVGFNS